MEGHFETRAGAPLILFGIAGLRPKTHATTRSSIPKLGSLILTHDSDGEVRG